MAAFLLRRLITGAITLFAVATLCFVLTRTVKGSPFSSEKNLHPEIIKNFERHYGLDQSVWVQYVRTLGGYLTGRLGPSMYYRDVSEVGDLVWPALRTSILLGSAAALLAFGLGVPLGLVASARQNRWPDHLASSVSVLGICVPNFLLGPLLVMALARWLPAGLWPQNLTSWEELRKLILPAVTLAMTHVAYVARLTRAGMLDVISRDYIRTARAKGLSEGAVFLKHVLKNGITPVVSYAGPMVAVLLTGAIVVENIFALPGLGQHFIKAASNRDMNLIMATVLVYSVLVVALNTVVDVLYGVLDPRVRVS
ncbi:MAG TPA: ABC transporter permease [Planctomycetota bacterium]